jgi:hypothetical protein
MSGTLHHWADHIAATPLSRWLDEQLWVVPTSQSVHIAALSIVFATALVTSMRLGSANTRGRPVSVLVPTLMPWMRGALLVLLVTGTVQTIAEPVRQFVTPAYWLKMGMIIVAVILTEAFARSVRNQPARWSGTSNRVGARLFAVIWLALWVGIIICGRFIGYTWESHA